MSLFIERPWLALAPAAVFFLLYRRSRRALVAGAALVWVLYTIYEFAMRWRWLCTGECNIRVDLVLLYPVLLVMSAAALVTALLTPTPSSE